MSVLRGLFTMGRVGPEGVEQPLQAGLIIVVFLALDDNFLSTINELITTLFGEILVCQEILGTVEFIASAIFVLPRDLVRQTVLYQRI